MLDYDSIKDLARATDCKTSDLIVLSSGNDPFYAGVPFRRERAEWFAEVWHRFDFRHGMHLRRVHYVLVSQNQPVRWPNGDAYQNTENDWKALDTASLAARYLGLIAPDVLVDRRNPDPVVTARFLGDPEPRVHLDSPDINLDLPSEFPTPELILSDFRRDQAFLVEVWAEKSTMNDILIPLAHRLGFNLITGVGEMSETATRLAVERAVDAGRPMRILYVSDFDPAGRSMPVAVARKIEHKLYAAGIGADITLQPIVLTPKQCAEFRLPRTPIKRTERRAARFEDRFGSGATELDALEALHPGKLAEIIEREACRYIDPGLSKRIAAAESDLYQKIVRVEEQVRDDHAAAIEDLSARYEAILNATAELEADSADLWTRMMDDLEARCPVVDQSMIPEPREAEPAEDQLYSSERSYLEQLDAYRKWQGK